MEARSLAKTWGRVVLLVVTLVVASRHSSRVQADRRGSTWSGPWTLEAVLGSGVYHPSGTPSDAAARTSAGLRWSFDAPPGFAADTVWLGLSGSTWSSPTEELVAEEGEIVLSYPGTRLLPFPNRVFYGAGLGAAQVTRNGTRLVNLPTVSCFGGLKTACGPFELEGRLKLVITHHDPVFDLSGPAVELLAIYPFGR
jgi:hypothetical protein